jgi:hypothetical protein
MRKPAPPKVSQIELKQIELNKLLVQYAITNIKNPRINKLKNEIDFFYFGLKI